MPIGLIILGVALMAASVVSIAQNMGSFGSQTTQQTLQITAGNVIQQGGDLETAVGRLLAAGTDLSAIIISPDLTGATNTQLSNALFAPSGGGLTPRKPPANAIPSLTTNWMYVENSAIDQVGTGANFVAVLQVKGLTICQAVNTVIFGATSAEATAAAIPTLATAPSLAAVTAALGLVNVANTFTTVGATGATVKGYTHACVGQGGSYYYYHVLVPG